ncbi:MAG: S8/S53 family peptidase [Myxococcales bacterium]|nr:S8/S53 family peptidase [Myxococcales bacterium]
MKRTLILPPLVAATLASGSLGCSTFPDSDPSLAERTSLPVEYVARRWVPELQQLVTIRKSPIASTVEYPDGRRERLEDLERKISGTPRQFAPAFLDQLEAADDGETIRAAVVVETDEVLASGGRGRPNGESASRAVATWLRAAGPEFRSVYASKFSAFVMLEASRSAWKALVARPPSGTMQVLDVRPRRSGEAFGIVDPTTVLRNDIEFNSNGNFGSGIRLGIIELGLGSGAIYDKHEAFALADIHYQTTPTSCDSDSDCVQPQQNACRNGRCTGAHATAVASVVSHAKSGGNRNASEASLYIANGGDACSLTDYIKQLDWLLENDVHVVTETFRCHGGSGNDGAHGYTTDYYARNFDMTFLVSSGNQTTGENDVACATTGNSVCTGGLDDVGRMFCASSHANARLGGYATDREEPDVVSYAGQGGSCVPSFNLMEGATLSGPTSWGGFAGTSGAAPSVASQLGLAAKACGLPYFEHLAARAAARNLAHVINPDGWKYSTPQPTPYGLLGPGDQKDGAGFPVFGPCAASDPDRVTGTTIPGETTSEPLPTGEYSNVPPGEVSPSSHNGPTGKPGYVLTARSLLAGARVRATISWDSCPKRTKVLDGTGILADLANDFDLYLYDKSRSRYVYGSQSLDDTNEGFDVVVPEDGDYELFIAWQGEVRKCEKKVDRVAHDVIFVRP